MNHRLCIGIQKLDESWQDIFDQLGIWVEEIDYKNLAPEQYSLLVLNINPGSNQKKKLEKYLNSGGAVVACFDVATFQFSGERIRSKKKYLLDLSRHPAIEHIPFLDLSSTVYLKKDSNIFEGLVQFQKVQNGHYAFFGANLPQLLNKSGYSRKRFFNPFGAYPDEIVSDVSKHKLLQIFEGILKELHFNRNLAFIKKWESPSKKPVFCFRIDSDYGDKISVNKLQKLAEEYNIPATWFLHVEAHEDWLAQFSEFEHQENALHGFSHGTSRSGSKVHANIKTGKEKLADANITVNGYCAPYGIWNKALRKSLSKMDFDYSSEFTFAYDGFPIQPKGKNLPIQIPIHPICPGSLNRHRQSVSEINTYFDYVMNNKLSRFEPVLLYHHPMQKGMETVKYIFKRANAENLEKLSFSDFAHFWKSRKKIQSKLYNTEDGIKIMADGNPDFWLYIAHDHHSFDLIPNINSVFRPSKSAEFEYMKQYLPTAEQVKEMRKQDLKLFKTSLLDWKNRKKL